MTKKNADRHKHDLNVGIMESANYRFLNCVVTLLPPIPSKLCLINFFYLG